MKSFRIKSVSVPVDRAIKAFGHTCERYVRGSYTLMESALDCTESRFHMNLLESNSYFAALRNPV